MSKRRGFDEQEQGGSPSGIKKPRVAGSAAPSFLPPRGDLAGVAASPSPGLPTRPAPTSAAPGGPVSAQDAIAAAKAKIQARLAAMQRGSAGAAAAAPTPAAPSQPAASTPEPKQEDGAASSQSATNAAIAEARKRIEAMKAKAAAGRSSNPYLATSLPPSQAAPAPSTSAGPSTGLHPLLADVGSYQAQTGKDRYKPMAPKFATIKANARQQQNTPTANPRATGKSGVAAAAAAKEGGSGLVYGSAAVAAGVLGDLKPGENPYFDASLGGGDAAPKERSSRQLKFVQKGKFTRLAEQMRQDQKLEALKARIAEASKRAGLEGEIELGALIKRSAPPEVEWWDTGFVDAPNYDAIPDLDELEMIKDESEAQQRVLKVIDLSNIGTLIQHPIPIPAPGDKFQKELKPLFLTKKEQKKLRRNRRAEELQDQQDRIRMGLAPPPPDKVKISNMYRVLTQEAVADPTKVEARVRKEMMKRQNAHEAANEERKLTDEQRREKLARQKEADEGKGIYGAIFKVRYLSDGGHKFKIKKNAEQNSLTGVLIFNPKFNLVYVEGGMKGIRAYTRLMTERIKWTEASAAKAGPATGDEGAAPAPTREASTLDNGTEEPHNLADNYCHLVWEGQQKERMFRGFRPKACPSDAMAKEFLGAQQGFWDVTKRYDPEAEGV